MFEHHATVLEGDTLASVAIPPEFALPSTDVIHIVTDRLSIADARLLQKEALARPLTDPYRTFVIVTRELPPESQNALLKLFEEPPATTRFILVIPRVDLLLPTLRSRVYVATGRPLATEKNAVFQAFLAAPVALRIEQIAQMVADKNIDVMEQLMRGAEVYVHEKALIHPLELQRVLILRDYFGRSGAARKMLLEELALLLPPR